MITQVEIPVVELSQTEFPMVGIQGVGESSVRKVKPYISGHITDGSSTFTFTVNSNESVTVPVDANGSWKWVADRKVTNLGNAFKNIGNISRVELVGFKDVTSLSSTFGYTSSNDYNLKTVVFENFNFENVTSEYYLFGGRLGLESVVGIDSTPHTNNESLNTAFQYCFALTFPDDFNWLNFVGSKVTSLLGTFYGCKVMTKADLRNATPTSIYYMFNTANKLTDLYLPRITTSLTNSTNWDLGASQLKNVNVDIIEVSLTFKSSKLTEQSVVNLFNAVAADGITLTFHATVFAMIEQQLEIEGSPIYEAYWNSDYDFNYASA